MSKRKRLQIEDYTVGWVCALPVELAAAAEMLDEEHEDIPRDSNDDNLYTLGRVGEHNVVIACLPGGQLGTSSAASVAMQLKVRFRSVCFGLMIGVGGGVPTKEDDIRLGDVVISMPQNQFGGVVQYDFGKTVGGQFTRTGSLNAPPTTLLIALTKLRANSDRGRTNLDKHLKAFKDLPKFSRERAGRDILFESDYGHIQGTNCDECSGERSKRRDPRLDSGIVVHFGTIASGNQVMQDGLTRDRLSSLLGGVLCFEMEAAGLMNIFPCLVIRGISDYADAHKNYQWQPFAAASAAACSKEILSIIPPIEVGRERTIGEVINSQAAHLKVFRESLFFSDIRAREDDISDAHPGTCKWIYQMSSSDDLQHSADSYKECNQRPNFREWLESDDQIFWITGKAGSGKSVLMKSIATSHETGELLRAWAGECRIILPSFYFWKYGPSDLLRTVRGMKQSILWRIIRTEPELYHPMIDGDDHLSDCSVKEFDTWTDAGLSKCLKRLLTNMPKNIRICFFIDGLDESTDEMDKVLNAIDILQLGGSNVKICVSSRPEQFSSDFRDVLQVRLQDCNRQDIEKAAIGNLIPLLKQYPYPERQYEIIKLITKIRDKSEGIFLWASLAIKTVKQGMKELEDIETLWSTFNVLPETIEDPYAHILGGISEKHRKEATVYFSLLLAKKQVVFESEYGLMLLHFAFTDKLVLQHFTNHDWSFYDSNDFLDRCRRVERRMEVCCAGLVDVKKNVANKDEHLRSFFREARFIHRSVAEFIENRFSEFVHGELLSISTTALPTLLECCLGFLSVLPKLADTLERSRLSKQAMEEVMGVCYKLDQLPEGVKDGPDRAYHILKETHLEVPLPRQLGQYHGSNYFGYRESFDGPLIHSPLTFAAYSGLEIYVRGYCRTHKLTPHDLNGLLVSSLAGVPGPFSGVESSTDASYRLAKYALDLGADPNFAFPLPHRHQTPSKSSMTCWTAFLESVLPAQIISDIYAPMPDFSSEMHIFEAFVQGGVDLNAIIYESQYIPIDRPITSFYLVLQESPLSFFRRKRHEFFEVSDAQYFTDLDAWLQHHNAHSHRRCIGIARWKPADKCLKTIYAFTDSEADLLLSEWNPDMKCDNEMPLTITFETISKIMTRTHDVKSYALILLSG